VLERGAMTKGGDDKAQPPYANPPPGVPGANTQISNQDRFFDLKTWGLQTQFTSRKSPRYLLTAGADLARDQTAGDNVRHRYWVDGYGTRVFTNTDRITASVPEGTFDSYATFAQSEWYLAPRAGDGKRDSIVAVELRRSDPRRWAAGGDVRTGDPGEAGLTSGAITRVVHEQATLLAARAGHDKRPER